MDQSETSQGEHNTDVTLSQQRFDHPALPVIPRHRQCPADGDTQQTHASFLQSSPARSALASQHPSNEANENQTLIIAASGLSTSTQHYPRQHAVHGARLHGQPQVPSQVPPRLQQYQTHVTDATYGTNLPTTQQVIESRYRQETQYGLQLGSVASGSTPSPYGAWQQDPSYYEPQQLTGVPSPVAMTQHFGNTYQRDSYGYTAVTVPQRDTYMAAGVGRMDSYLSHTPQEPQRTPSSPSHIDPVYHDYQTRIRGIFTLVLEGDLRDINRHLTTVAHYLLDNVEAWGLSNDVDELHDERIRLWDEFNNAWLTALQRQLDLTEMVFRTNAPLPGPQSIMTKETLQSLAAELIRMCNDVERHGLVDYQMGVAEEQIIDLLMRCVSLLDPTRSSESEDSEGGG